MHSIRLGDDANTWQFHILPGIDDRTAKVRFVYSVSGDRLTHLTLTSPQLHVPLENIQWNVIAPQGFELTDNDGNLELIREASQAAYDRNSYLSRFCGKRKVQAQQAIVGLNTRRQRLYLDHDRRRSAGDPDQPSRRGLRLHVQSQRTGCRERTAET